MFAHDVLDYYLLSYADEPLVDLLWGQVYPDNYLPFYPERGPHLSYASSLMIDGRYHDALLYSKLKNAFLARNCRGTRT